MYKLTNPFLSPQSRRWRFELHMLPGHHCAAVALGPAAEAVDEWGVSGT